MTTSDQKLETLANSTHASTWGYDLADGDYSVTLRAGDPQFYQSGLYVEVEGTIIANNIPKPAGQYVELNDELSGGGLGCAWITLIAGIASRPRRSDRSRAIAAR